MILPDFTDRLNHFLYRRSIRQLSASDIELARTWTLDFIRREHPSFTEEQVSSFYENLLHVQVRVVDEWQARLS